MQYLLLITIPSFLEAVTILSILYMINFRTKLRWFQVFIFATIFSVSATTMDLLQVPFPMIFSIILCAVLIILIIRPLKKVRWLYAIDVVLSFVILALIQIAITAMAGVFGTDIINNEIAINLILIGLIVLFLWLSSKRFLQAFFVKYYYPYRIAILSSIISLVFIITIIGDMFFYNEHLFTAQGADRLIIVIIGYYVLNTFFVVNLFRVSKIKRENIAIKGYGEHLQNIVNSNRAEDHDWRHQLNIINSFNRTPDGDVILVEQYEYIMTLICSGKTGDTSIIKDDVLISAILYDKKEFARQKNITFEVHIANSLSFYKMPSADLTSILINLIDNAFEEVENFDIEDRIVQLDFYDKYIEIRNIISLASVINDAGDMQTLFKQGYSTKGSERGFGLSNVKTTSEKYGVRINTRLEKNMFVQELDFSDI